MPCTETVIEAGRVIYRDCHTHKPVGERREKPTRGPGTELKKLLAGWPFRIMAKPNCSCNARARTMDERGCDWCSANEGTIIGWLREEAAKRRILFIEFAARMVVRKAIANARKASS
jgi:hypothetical protein